MAIDDRNLEVGSRLVATYKKVKYLCMVEKTQDDVVEYVLEDARRFKSPSAAASAVMGGQAANGWRFWSLETDVATPEPKAEKPAKGKKGAILRRTPNQKNVADGQVRYFCAACLKSYEFDAAAGEPESCPEGHKASTEEFFAETAS